MALTRGAAIFLLSGFNMKKSSKCIVPLSVFLMTIFLPFFLPPSLSFSPSIYLSIYHSLSLSLSLSLNFESLGTTIGAQRANCYNGQTDGRKE